ncbi:MAG: aspartate racemase [Planctomyces sp.]|nr:aspartate racemase [Planctomyces sp.]MBA4039486.1 aspartate racemase [Planctomyces sp.]
MDRVGEAGIRRWQVRVFSRATEPLMAELPKLTPAVSPGVCLPPPTARRAGEPGAPQPMGSREVVMHKHIGIVAASPEGAAICYRDIHRTLAALLGDRGHPRITLHGEPFERYIDAVAREDWHGIGELLLRSARALKDAGADFCVLPDNLMQHAVHLAEPTSPIPWLNMTDLVADAVAGDGRRVVGLIGTKKVMRGSTYQTLLGLRGVKLIVPSDEEAERIDRIIFRELVLGQAIESSRARVIESIAQMARRGAEAVILGCTEAPLLVSTDNCPLPMYDSTQLLADGAVRRSLGDAWAAAVSRAGAGGASAA